jgi:hypothetical protein
MARIAALQSGRNPSTVAGVVLDTNGAPVAGALVRIDAPVRAAITDSTGRFEIRTLPARELVVRVSREGLVAHERLVRTSSGGTAELRLVLAPEAPKPRH